MAIISVPEVILFANARQNHLHTSFVHAGLDILARGKRIKLITSSGESSDAGLLRDSLTVCLMVKHEGSAPTLVAIDLHDQSREFAPDALARCDLYLKRSFDRAEVARLDPALAAKVIPFGLNYPCSSFETTLRWLGPSGRKMFARRSDWLKHMRRQVVMPPVRRYEQSPDAKVEPTLIFQPRLWEEHEAPGEADSINRQRVELLRALRSAFGGRLVGGLVRTRLAIEQHPDDLTNQPTRHSQYIAISKRNLIGIYTRGLWGSAAFKLSEYLAASQCIVAEPLTTELPVPLAPGTHYLPFTTPAECIDACHRLLRDPALAGQMRQANHQYYVEHVEPSARMARVIQLAISDAASYFRPMELQA